MLITLPTATANVGDDPRRCTQHRLVAEDSRFNIERRSNVTTSNSLIVLSSSAPAVAKVAQSALRVELCILPLCARYSFANSIPVAAFFQNLTTPSIEVVMTKSTGDGATVTEATWSLCINDLEYRTPFGRASTYKASYGSLRFFLGGTEEGRAGPKSSSDESLPLMLLS